MCMLRASCIRHLYACVREFIFIFILGDKIFTQLHIIYLFLYHQTDHMLLSKAILTLSKEGGTQGSYQQIDSPRQLLKFWVLCQHVVLLTGDDKLYADLFRSKSVNPLTDKNPSVFFVRWPQDLQKLFTRLVAGPRVVD